MKLIFILLTLVITGCATTEAQKQQNYIRATLNDTFKKVEGCTAENEKSSSGQTLKEKVVVFSKDQANRFELLRSKDKISDDLKPLLVEFLRINEKCRSIRREGLAKSHPLLLMVQLDHWKALDDLNIKLLENEINIGEFNKRIDEVALQTEKKWNEAGMKIDSNLAESHNREIEQEMKAYENRRSVNTYCNKVGNAVICNSH